MVNKFPKDRFFPVQNGRTPWLTNGGLLTRITTSWDDPYTGDAILLASHLEDDLWCVKVEDMGVFHGTLKTTLVI